MLYYIRRNTKPIVQKWHILCISICSTRFNYIWLWLFKLCTFCAFQLCRYTAPVPHLAVYAGMCESQSTASPGLMTLPNSAVCPSPISVAIDSTPASERRFDGGAPASSHFPSITESTEASVSQESQPLASKSRVALSLSRILRRGCNAPSMFASLSPKCAVTAGGGRVQPLGVDQLAQPQPKRIAKLVRPNK